ncbi:MAG: hypothetical protein FK734_04850 [Asgard group archaeon]|nr:hypothetical protein [Asgard group archaeon]
MSQNIEKAEALEAKGKWKNAAETYFLAAEELQQSGKKSEAESILLKAISNAHKAENSEQIVEFTFGLLDIISTDKEKKNHVKLAIKSLDELLEIANSKNKYNDLVELIKKKESAAILLGQDIEKTKIEYGWILQKYSLTLLVSKKDEDRNLGFELLHQSSDKFIEINKKELVIQSKTEALVILFESNYIEEGFTLFEQIIEFCKSQQLVEQANIPLEKLIEYSEDILLGKGSKKIIKGLSDYFQRDDPGKLLLDKVIAIAKEFPLNDIISKSAIIYSEVGNELYNKKKIDSSIEFYQLSLSLLVEINDIETSKTIAKDIIEKGYSLLDQKGNFKYGIDFLTLIHLIEKVDLEYVGEFFTKLAENMFQRERLNLAMQYLTKASKAYLFAKNNDKFIEITNTIYKFAISLIIDENYNLAFEYIKEANNILNDVQSFDQIGSNLTYIAIELIKKQKYMEAEDLSLSAVDNLVKAGDIEKAAHSHRLFGESYIGLENYEKASFHLIEAAKMFKDIELESEINSTQTPLLIAAKNKLANNDIILAKELLMNAAQCARQKDPLTESNLITEFVEYAITQNQMELALTQLRYIFEILGDLYPNETAKLTKITIENGKRLIVTNHNFVLGKAYIDTTINALLKIDKHTEAAEIVNDFSDLLFEHNQKELAKDLLEQLAKILSTEENPEIFAGKISTSAKLLIENGFIENGIEQLRKAIGAYISLGKNDPVIQLAFYCTDIAQKSLANDVIIAAKHLFIAAMEFSALVNLETHDQILAEATNLFLEANDLYSVREFYDYAKNNLEGEKDYLAKLARLIIVQGGNLRDSLEMYDEASDFIRNGIKILNQIGLLSEAGEAALAQGKAFISRGSFIFGEELIETGAQIFIQTNDIERSGDAFLSLAEINILRELWSEALKQIELANKSFIESTNFEKLAISILKTAEIGAKSLINNPNENREISVTCFDVAINMASTAKLIDTEIDIYLTQAKAFVTIKDYPSAFNTYVQVNNLLEQKDEIEKSQVLAEELSVLANQLILENEIEIALQLVDLVTGTFLRLVQPISASEVYMKACNTLLKINNIVEGVRLVLLASDTLMVANEYDAAVKILEEIADLLYGMKDYQNASIVTGQIVTVHQKTGQIDEQKKALYKLVEKTKEVIRTGQIMDGEQLWEQASNYSISTNLEFAVEINNLRIESLMNAGMFNSVNNAFNQLITILESNKEQLEIQGDKVANIAGDLFNREEYELAKNFIFTAIDFYKASNKYDKAMNLCLFMSQHYVQKDDETSGIEFIDQAAKIANEKLGAHEAAKIYLTSGFILVESGFSRSGNLSVKKAIDIELQTKNTTGCLELGDITLAKASETAQNDTQKANEIYQLAATIFESAGAFTRAGDTCINIIMSNISDGNVKEALETSEKAVDYYVRDNNIDSAVGITRQVIESARRFMEENELTKAVMILEKGRLLVEKISRFDILSLIISIYLSAANQNLPNRKSAIGIFFLNRALKLALTSPEPDEMNKVIDLGLKLSIETIKKKNSIAGAKALEIISKLEITQTAMVQQLAETYVEAIKLTLDTEWNMIGKLIRDALIIFKKLGRIDVISQLIAILINRANADIMMDKPQLGLYFLDNAIKLARDANNPELLSQIGLKTYEQLLTLSQEGDLEINYKMLGYCYQLFLEIKNVDFIDNIGKEFVKLGSKDLISNMCSIRGYEALLTARDIAIQSQNEILMTTVITALLDFALQLSSTNPNTVLSTLEDIIQGLEGYEVPNSERASIDYNVIGGYIKNISSFGDKVSKSESDFQIGKKIIESCLRIEVLSRNQQAAEDDVLDVQRNLQKILKRGTHDSAYRLKHAAIMNIDLNNPNEAAMIAENCFITAQGLFDKKKYQETISYLDAALKINDLLTMQTELKNIGLFALNAGDRLVNETKIVESMIFYDIAVEAFDEANDEENSNRLINRIFQTREWDADHNIAYRCYKVATESAIRVNNKQKAHEVATKCFNRGIAFIDQPQIPTSLSNKFINLAGKVLEDIGAIKDAANAYDNAILKFIRVMKARKNIEPIIVELLAKTAVNRMAGCDMDSLETIFLRIMEFAELKKVKHTKIIAQLLKLINTSKVRQAWDLIASLPYISHGRLRKIMNATKNRIIYDLNQKGTFDRTIFSSTDRSLPLSDYLIDSLQISRKIEGQPINKDVFISHEKIKAIRNYFFSEFELWGRIDLEAITKEFNIQPNDAVSIVRREFLSAIYMAVLDNAQKVFYSFDRLKAEISLILNRERKKASIFDPMQVANEMKIPPDIIKEVLREISCEEVVESATS